MVFWDSAAHPVRAQAKGESEIFGTKARVFGDPGEGGGADLFVVVEAECEVRPTRALQLSM